MARKAGVISISVEAGTAKFLADMDQANAKVGAFGAAAGKANAGVVSSTKATTAAIKGLEGGFANNNKAAAAFITTMLGGGPVLQAAFPIFGALAFAGVLTEIGTGAAKFFKDMKTAPDRVARSFREMNAPLRLTNDELAVTNARLENEIAQLEGRRENTLKLALAEAVKVADQLADSLDKDLVNLNKLLKENDIGFWKGLLGPSETGYIRKEFGGETGSGGFQDTISRITEEGNEAIRKATTLKEKDAAQTALNTRLTATYAAELAKVNGWLKNAETLGKDRQVTSYTAGRTGNISANVIVPGQDTVTEQELLRAARGQLISEMSRIERTALGSGLTEKKESLAAARANAALTKPFDDRLKSLQTQLEGARAKMAEIGMGPEAKAMAEGYAEALKAITDLNRELDKHHIQLTGAQKSQIAMYTTAVAVTGQQAAWKERLVQTTAQIADQVRTQELLTAAVGKGAEAERRARVETQVMGAVGGELYNDPKWMAAHAGDVAKLRSGFTASATAERAQGAAAAVYSLEQQIRLEKMLADAQKYGEEEVRRITAMEIWRAGLEKGLTGQQIALELSYYYAKQRTHNAAAQAQLEAETTATERLAAAHLRGAEAARQQGLENKYAEMARTDSGANVPVARARDEAAHQLGITQRVAERVNLYGNELEKLDQERDKLLQIVGAHKATADQARALRDIQNDRLQLWAREQLALGTARGGVQAFFAEMQAGAKRTGNIIYEALTSGVERVSDEMAKLLTGQQTNFGRMLQGLGEDMLRSSIKSGLQKGLGALGSLLGIKGPEGKPDGSAAKPFHVIVDNAGVAGPGYTPAGGYSAAGGLLSAAAPFVGDIGKSAGGGIIKFLNGLLGLGKELVPSVSSSISYRGRGRSTFAGGGLHCWRRGPGVIESDVGVHHEQRGAAADDGRRREQLPRHGGCARR